MNEHICDFRFAIRDLRGTRRDEFSEQRFLRLLSRTCEIRGRGLLALLAPKLVTEVSVESFHEPAPRNKATKSQSRIENP